MAGHSQFKNIMHRKGRQDKQRAKVFSRLSRELTVAVKMGGDDPSSNPRLRLAIQEARGHNMPKQNIERAIGKAAGGEGEEYEEVTYEGYGPAGVGYVIEALTDNRNRTAASLRGRFSKLGGTLAEGGAVTFQFERIGEIVYPAAAAAADAVLEAAVESGADDAISDEDTHRILCARESLAEVARQLEELIGSPPLSAKLVWSPKHSVTVEEGSADTILRLYDSLNDDDDVQAVYSNFDMPDELLLRLAA